MKREAAAAAIGLTLGFFLASLVAASTPAGLTGFMKSVIAAATTPRTLESTILVSTPIALSAVGLTLTYRARFITIASEGQVIAGSAVALWITAYSGLTTPVPVTKVIALVLASATGAAIALGVAALRLYLGVNEILSSLMLNYVVMYFINYAVSGPWRSGTFTITRSVPGPYRVSWVEAAAATIVVAVMYWLLAKRTHIGFEIDALGRAPRAALTYGVRPRRLITLASMLQGASAGLGGALFILGFQYVLTPMSAPPGYGYMGVLVAWLAFLDPLGSVAASLLYGFIGRIARLLQGYGVGFGVALAMQSTILLTLVTVLALQRRSRR